MTVETPFDDCVIRTVVVSGGGGEAAGSVGEATVGAGCDVAAG